MSKHHLSKVMHLLHDANVDELNEYCELPVNPFTEEEQQRVEKWLTRLAVWAKMKDLSSDKKELTLPS